jgi:ketosteroid isomerase-like protein
MANTTLGRELLDLENQYWQAMKEKDVDAAMRLTDEECIVTGAQGVGRVDRQALGDMLKNAPYTLHSFELKDAEVRQIRDDVAVVAYKVHEDLTVDGKPVKLEAADASTWVRRGGKWLCALHTEAITGDPFGRDRRVNS